MRRESLKHARNVNEDWWDGDVESGPFGGGNGPGGGPGDMPGGGPPGEPPDDLDPGDFDISDFDDLSDTQEVTEDGFEELDTEYVGADLSDTVADRDDRIESFSGSPAHERVRDHLRETGLMDELCDRVEDLGYRERDETREEGDILDMRNITRRLAGDTTVRDYYQRPIPRPGGDVAVGVSLDMSGSMRGSVLDAKSAVGAFLFAVQQAGNRVVANAWRERMGTAEVQILTAPGEQFAWSHLDATNAGGRTPTALGIWECGLMLERVSASERLLIVITDGEPSVYSRDEVDASTTMDETTLTVEQLRNRGLNVVAFGFGRRATPEKLAEQFGDDGYQYVDIEHLADALVDVYGEQVGDATVDPEVI